MLLSSLRSARPVKRFGGGRQSKSVDLLNNGAVRKRFDGSAKHVQKMRIEIANLQKLQQTGCDFVPRLLAVDDGQRTIYLSYVGSRPKKYTADLRRQVQSKVDLLKTKYGLQRTFGRTGMPRLANVAVDKANRVYLIDFGPPWRSV
jgi:tRNA A-37 threonylcarbamoyl transferase component Bud32